MRYTRNLLLLHHLITTAPAHPSRLLFFVFSSSALWRLGSDVDEVGANSLTWGSWLAPVSLCSLIRPDVSFISPKHDKATPKLGETAGDGSAMSKLVMSAVLAVLLHLDLCAVRLQMATINQAALRLHAQRRCHGTACSRRGSGTDPAAEPRRCLKDQQLDWGSLGKLPGDSLKSDEIYKWIKSLLCTFQGAEPLIDSGLRGDVGGASVGNHNRWRPLALI
jgi:hypothetical protein